MTDWAEHLRIVVRRCFPPDARVIRLPQNEDLVFAISWKLNTDPDRPTKRSKTIRLKIAEEAVLHYQETSDATRKGIDTRLERSLRKELSEFDPEHQVPEGHEIPVVHWVINSVVMG